MSDYVPVFRLDQKWIDFINDNNLEVIENEYGYGRICLENTHCLLHRLIIGAAKGEVVDHKNGDPKDNRELNLRITSVAGNARNSGLSSRNTSGEKGVWFDKNRNIWRCEIRYKGKKYQIGRFHNLECAKVARRLVEAELFGEHMRDRRYFKSRIIKKKFSRDDEKPRGILIL